MTISLIIPCNSAIALNSMCTSLFGTNTLDRNFNFSHCYSLFNYKLLCTFTLYDKIHSVNLFLNLNIKNIFYQPRYISHARLCHTEEWRLNIAQPAAIRVSIACTNVQSTNYNHKVRTKKIICLFAFVYTTCVYACFLFLYI